MKKKNLKSLFLSLLVVGSSISLVTSSLAWFKYGTDVTFGDGNNVPLSAGAEGAYFGGGDGSEGNPYIISERIHLYNLAWLQYIGYFNTGYYLNEDDANYNADTYIQEMYFEITSNLDMEGIVLPPIGTETYPFFSHLDGNNKKIINLTVSNDDPTKTDSDFGVMKPSSIPDHAEQPRVVGFFGAVGLIPTNTNLEESDVSGITPSMSNLTLDGITVQSKTNETLIGLAAGYVDGGMSNIKVSGESSLNVSGQSALDSLNITDKLSDYALVGYSKQKGTGGDYSQTVSKYYDSTLDPSGEEDEWGGSIDMNATYERLSVMKNRAGTLTAYPFVTEVNYVDGEEESSTTTTTQEYYRYTANTGNDYVGNFNFGNVTGDKHYLMGGTYETSNYYISSPVSGYYITDGEGNYLTRTLTNSTINYLEECVWDFEVQSGNGYIRNYQESTGIYYYLVNNYGNLQITTNQNEATDWNIEQDEDELNISCSYNGSTLLLRFINDVWGLFDSSGSEESDPYFSIMDSNETYYLPTSIIGNNNTILTGSTTEYFTFSNIASGSNVSFDYLGTTYYLKMYRYSNSTYYVTAQTTPGNSGTRYYQASFDNANRIVATRNGTTYYLRYNSGWSFSTTSYTLSISENTTTIFYNTFILDNVFLEDPINVKTLDKTTQGMKFRSDDTTYFPLNVDGNYAPTLTNTGYVVAATTGNSTGTGYRSMVVSSYDRSVKIPKSSTVSNNKVSLTNIKTVNSSGITNWSGGVKYEASKSKLENVLSDSSDGKVGGLHFVNQGGFGKISKDNILEATNISLGGTNYPTYQLPAYSIDFNLKRRGIINFFAGCYNGQNSTGPGSNMNGFFSLHQVFRDNDKNISDIKEIQGIYSRANSNTYIYSYKGTDGEVDMNGDAFSSSGLTLEFNTDWIAEKNATLGNTWAGYVFYFEIPVNAGEFCLGNMADADDGCYLMYLDIGANGSEDKDIIYSYSITSETGLSYFPIGVDFAVINCGNSGGESICVYVDKSASGLLVFSTNESGTEIEISDSGGISTYSYQGSRYSETIEANKFTVTGNSPGAMEDLDSGYKRQTFIKVITIDGSVYNAVITDTLNDSKEITSSSYTLGGEDVTLSELQEEVEALTNSMIETIRGLEDAIVIYRETGLSIFEISLDDLPWEDVNLYNVIVALGDDITLTITRADSSYSVTINNDILVFDDNEASYPNP